MWDTMLSIQLCFAYVSLCRIFFSDFIIRNRCSCNVAFKFFISSFFFSSLNCLVMLFKVHCEVRHSLRYKWSCSVSFCCCTCREFWLLFFALKKKTSACPLARAPTNGNNRICVLIETKDLIKLLLWWYCDFIYGPRAHTSRLFT